LNLSWNQKLTPDEVSSIVPLQKGVHPQNYSKNALSVGDFTINLNEVVLFDADGDLATTNDQIVANGSIKLNPEIELNAIINWFHLDKFSFTTTMNESSDLTISSKVTFASASYKGKLPNIILSQS